MLKSYKLCFLIFSLLIIVTACGGLETQDRLSRLSDSVLSYGGAIRWQRYGDAYQFHLGQDGYRPSVDYTKYENVKVTAYQVVNQTVDSEKLESEVTAIIKYYRDDTGTEQSITHTQNWWFNEELKRWMVDAAFPVFE